MNDELDYDALCLFAGADGHNLSCCPNIRYGGITAFPYKRYYEPIRPILLSHRLDDIPHPSYTSRYAYLGTINDVRP